MRAKHLNFLTPEQPECLPFLNMPTQTYPNTLSFHTEKLEKLVEDLESKFPNQPIHPKEELPSIMYKAGQHSVVQYIKQLLEER